MSFNIGEQVQSHKKILEYLRDLWANVRRLGTVQQQWSTLLVVLSMRQHLSCLPNDKRARFSHLSVTALALVLLFKQHLREPAAPSRRVAVLLLNYLLKKRDPGTTSAHRRTVVGSSSTST